MVQSLVYHECDESSLADVVAEKMPEVLKPIQTQHLNERGHIMLFQPREPNHLFGIFAESLVKYEDSLSCSPHQSTSTKPLKSAGQK